MWEGELLPFGEPLSITGSVVNNLRFPGQYYDAETGKHYNGNRYYDPTTGRYLEIDPIGFEGGINHFVYADSNPITFIDPYGLTLKTNWEFFWDWVLEQGEEKREYGEGTVELEEMKSSPGAAKMRAAFKANMCESMKNQSFGTVEAYFKTIFTPNSSAFQVGGFLYDAVNNGDGTVTYTIRNQASAYSLFLHIPFIPHKKRGGTLHLFGNIDQVFQWTEKAHAVKGK